MKYCCATNAETYFTKGIHIDTFAEDAGRPSADSAPTGPESGCYSGTISVKNAQLECKSGGTHRGMLA